MKQNLKAAWNSLVFTLNLVAESGLWIFGMLVALMVFTTGPAWGQAIIGLFISAILVVSFSQFKKLDEEKENNDENL